MTIIVSASAPEARTSRSPRRRWTRAHRISAERNAAGAEVQPRRRRRPALRRDVGGRCPYLLQGGGLPPVRGFPRCPRAGG
jgi:hypothetical protein